MQERKIGTIMTVGFRANKTGLVPVGATLLPNRSPTLLVVVRRAFRGLIHLGLTCRRVVVETPCLSYMAMKTSMAVLTKTMITGSGS